MSIRKSMHAIPACAVVACMLFGAWVLGARHEAEYQRRNPPTPTVKYLPAPKPETKVIYQVPQECKDALALTNKIRTAAGAYETATGPQLDLMSQAVRAIADRDYKTLNELIRKQNEIRTKTLAAQGMYDSDTTNFDYVWGKCTKKLEN